ncbi:hypothetical protein F5B19DRAFT_400889 [Rostrohypoxylon terebratum]|nr:hypothetical protein F5B19DRAFT_400889 [Rostrohypoxylon terebratum]
MAVKHRSQPKELRLGIEKRCGEEVDDRFYPNQIRIGIRDGQQPCVDRCYNQFVEEWYGKTHGGFPGVCSQLADRQPSTELWRLYCCDSTNCGVVTEVKGQSPSVDLIINKCQNVGNYLIYDPGPPQLNNFNCSSLTNESAGGESILPTSLSNSSPSAIQSATPTSSATAAATSLSSKLNSTASGLGAVPSTTMGLTEGSKAAIGICSSLAIIAILFLVGFLINRRRSRPMSFAGARDSHPPNSAPRLNPRSSSSPPSGSHTPLITPPSPAKGHPLTPPARLSDRRFLPPLLKQGQGQGPFYSGTPISSLAGAPEDRAYHPTAPHPLGDKKPALRQPAPPNTARSAGSPSLPSSVHFAPQFLRDSGSSSYSSGRGGGGGTSSQVASGMQTPPLSSPTRPSRALGRLDIPGEVGGGGGVGGTPVGPPPSRALPAPPPPYHPVSPTFSVSPLTPASSPPLPLRGLGVGDGTRGYSGSQLGNGNGDGEIKGLSSSAKDLCELTESYARETAESWGSWNGGGGSGVGVTAGRKRGSGGRTRELVHGEKKGDRGSLVSLQELDLERLGGKY